MIWRDAGFVVLAVMALTALYAIQQELAASRVQQREHYARVAGELSKMRDILAKLQSIAESTGRLDMLNEHVFAIREHLMPGTAESMEQRLLSAAELLRRAVEKRGDDQS